MSRTSTGIDLSLIVPCHNEEGNVEALLQAVVDVFEPAGVSIEAVFVDDGSTDATLQRLRALATGPLAERCPVQVVVFSRNFGKECAMHAGMAQARGDNLCFIDADLQQDPAVALEMFEYLMQHDECDVVAAYQNERSEGAAVSWLKRRFYSVFNATSDEIDLPADASDFRVFRRQVAEAMLELPEHFRFSKGLFAWVGFTTHAIPYTARERHSGTSNWSVWSLFKYALAGITSFSTWPLKALKFIGGFSFVGSLLYLLYVIIFDYLIFGVDVPGYTTVVCLILIFGGLQLLAIGIVGDYLARSYVEGKHRPLYIVKERFDSGAE